jgi:hypothetical protein
VVKDCDQDLPVEIKPRHEDNAINAHLPLQSQHFSGFSPDSTHSNILVTILLCLDELLAFWKTDTNKSDSNGDTCGSPENSLKISYQLNSSFRKTVSVPSKTP